MATDERYDASKSIAATGAAGYFPPPANVQTAPDTSETALQSATQQPKSACFKKSPFMLPKTSMFITVQTASSAKVATEAPMPGANRPKSHDSPAASAAAIKLSTATVLATRNSPEYFTLSFAESLSVL